MCCLSVLLFQIRQGKGRLHTEERCEEAEVLTDQMVSPGPHDLTPHQLSMKDEDEVLLLKCIEISRQ